MSDEIACILTLTQNLDTAKIIEGPNVSGTCFVVEVSDPDSNLSLNKIACLEQLHQIWEGMTTQFSIHEEFVDCFNNHLAGLATTRIENIHCWLNTIPHASRTIQTSKI